MAENWKSPSQKFIWVSVYPALMPAQLTVASESVLSPLFPSVVVLLYSTLKVVFSSPKAVCRVVLMSMLGFRVVSSDALLTVPCRDEISGMRDALAFCFW